MKTKYVLWIALGMVLGNLLLGAVPARGATTKSIVADNDTYVYEGGPDTNYDGTIDGGSRISFGNVSGYPSPGPGALAIAYFHFPFTFKPAEFSSAIITIFYDTVNVAFGANVSLVPDNTWEEGVITWNTKPAKGALLGIESIELTSTEKKSFTINVTTKITGETGISICVESLDPTLQGYGQAITQENGGSSDLGAYVPVLTWTYEEFPIWIYLLAGAVVAVVVVVVVIKKRKGGRSASPATPKGAPASKEAPESKAPSTPQEPSASTQPPSSPESPGPQEPPTL